MKRSRFPPGHTLYWVYVNYKDGNYNFDTSKNWPGVIEILREFKKESGVENIFDRRADFDIHHEVLTLFLRQSATVRHQRDVPFATVFTPCLYLCHEPSKEKTGGSAPPPSASFCYTAVDERMLELKENPVAPPEVTSVPM